MDERMTRARARRLLLTAQAACDAQDYRLCSVVSAEARRLDPELPEAIRLYHRARLALELGRNGEATTPTDTEESRP